MADQFLSELSEGKEETVPAPAQERTLVHCVREATFEGHEIVTPDCVRSDTRRSVLPVAPGYALIITDVTMVVGKPGHCKAQIYPALQNKVVSGTNFLNLAAEYERVTHLSFNAPAIYAVPGEEITIDARSCDVPASYNLQGYLIPHEGEDRTSQR